MDFHPGGSNFRSSLLAMHELKAKALESNVDRSLRRMCLAKFPAHSLLQNGIKSGPPSFSRSPTVAVLLLRPRLLRRLLLRRLPPPLVPLLILSPRLHYQPQHLRWLCCCRRGHRTCCHSVPECILSPLPDA
jgi:hypothetical protein